MSPERLIVLQIKNVCYERASFPSHDLLRGCKYNSVADKKASFVWLLESYRISIGCVKGSSIIEINASHVAKMLDYWATLLMRQMSI